MTMKPLGDEDSDDGEVEFEISTTEEWGAIGFNSGKNKMVRKWIRSDTGNERKAYHPCSLVRSRFLGCHATLPLIKRLRRRLTILVTRHSAGYFMTVT